MAWNNFVNVLIDLILVRTRHKPKHFVFCFFVFRQPAIPPMFRKQTTLSIDTFYSPFSILYPCCLSFTNVTPYTHRMTSNVKTCLNDYILYIYFVHKRSKVIFYIVLNAFVMHRKWFCVCVCVCLCIQMRFLVIDACCTKIGSLIWVFLHKIPAFYWNIKKTSILANMHRFIFK